MTVARPYLCAIARWRREPADDLLGDLIRAQTEDGDRLGDDEMVTLVWHLLIAGQTPANLIANAALLRRFPRLTATSEELRAPDPGTWRLTSLPVTL